MSSSEFFSPSPLSSRRLPWRALFCSLAAHLALLAAVAPWFREWPAAQRTRLAVQVVQRPVPVRPLPDVVAPPAPEPSAKQRPAPRRQAPTVAPRLAVLREAPVAAPDIAPAVESAVESVVKSAAAPLPGPSAASAPPAAAEVDADDVREYRMALAVEARRFRRYPALARERGWQGEAEVELRVGGSAPAPLLQIGRSSGHAVLDAQALDMMTRAASVVPVPRGLKGHALRLLLPVRFSLEGADRAD